MIWQAMKGSNRGVVTDEYTNNPSQDLTTTLW